jgi:hypothetical protein
MSERSQSVHSPYRINVIRSLCQLGIDSPLNADHTKITAKAAIAIQGLYEIRVCTDNKRTNEVENQARITNGIAKGREILSGIPDEHSTLVQPYR